MQRDTCKQRQSQRYREIHVNRDKEPEIREIHVNRDKEPEVREIHVNRDKEPEMQRDTCKQRQRDRDAERYM